MVARLPFEAVSTPRHEPGSAGPLDFSTAYLAHGQAIYAYTRRMLGRDPDAEDATVLTFEKALRAWARRPPDSELRPWLFRIATNVCLDELRRQRRHRWQPWDALAAVLLRATSPADDPEEAVLRLEDQALIRRALDDLSPKDRAALILRECQGLSLEEVGHVLGISHGAAKVALFRARERLRASYRQLGGELPRRGQQGFASRSKAASARLKAVPES